VPGAAACRLTFSVPETNPHEEARGASVRYEADGTARLPDGYEPTPGRARLVEWDAATGAGSVTAWSYNDGGRACWDANLDAAPGL